MLQRAYSGSVTGCYWDVMRMEATIGLGVFRVWGYINGFRAKGPVGRAWE